MNHLLNKDNYTSENLYEKINLLSDEQINAIDNGLKWTTKNIKNAVIIGGMGTVYYVSNSRKLTPDLDYLTEDIELVKTKLSAGNKVFRSLDAGYEYSLGVTVDLFNTDFLDSEVGNVTLNKLILQTPNTAKIGGYIVKIVNPELLSIMKFSIGREKDISDGFALLSTGKCSLEKYKSYVSILGNTLQDYNSIFEYQALIK